jgi:hypothetical protein
MNFKIKSCKMSDDNTKFDLEVIYYLPIGLQISYIVFPFEVRYICY